MKLTDANLEQRKLSVGQYGFSHTKLADLGASEYTLVTIVQDVSGSVKDFKKDMEECIKSVMSACKFSERADNLLVRLVTFTSRGDRPAVEEIHGFKLLEKCNLDDYTDCLQPGGNTPLFDATENAIRATMTYGRDLIAQEYSANGIVIIISDGDDNNSTFKAHHCATAGKEAVSQETLESFVSILIGVNVKDPHIGQRLAQFQAEAGLTQYVEMTNATPKTLAKLADFISKSISSQSKALGTGGPSQPIQPTI